MRYSYAAVFAAFCFWALASCNPGGDSDPDTVDSGASLSAAAQKGTGPLSRTVIPVTDLDPDPHVFQAQLSVDEQDVNIGGDTVHAIIYRDLNNPGAYAGITDGIPVLQFEVEVGDEIVVSLTNDLDNPCAAIACDTSIHWHGLELDNDSDGTGVTQNSVKYGETYTYRFKTFRPGIFWFHPHMKPGPQTFAGTYGAFIVRDPGEAALVSANRIPAESNTHTLVFSDIEYDSEGDVGFLDAGNAVPWATRAEECKTMGTNCTVVANGDTVLVNGQNPAAATPTITAKSGAGIRLRLLNLSTNRYYRLVVSGNGSDDNLYRIGGEGGFLEQVRLEGGVHGGWDTKYNPGEIVLPASGRSDVVIVPTGNHGDTITISGADFSRSGPPGNDDTAGPLLEITIDNTLDDTAFAIAAGNDVLGPGGVDDLKSLVISDFYLAPPVFDSNPGAGHGSADPVMRLQGISSGKIAIDGVIGEFEDSGPDFSQVPYQDATRYALTGDVLEFTVSNHTQQHHPFHHHGFSFQPVRVIDNGADLNDPTDDTILYEFDYNEFVDVIDVYGFPLSDPANNSQSVVLRMRLDDRQRITDNRQEMGAPAPNQRFGSGGAAGRWVLHCHLFLHASIGMISELVVLNTDRDGDGVTTEFDCNDFDPNVTGCPPTAHAGPDQLLECGSPGGAMAMLDGTASSDPDMDSLTYAWTAPGIVFDDATSATPTATFPLGDTTVTLTVSDGVFEDTDEVVISVVDTTPPTISVSLDPDSLWPPNHQMVTINANVQVADSCDANPAWMLTSASSNEPDNGQADGNTVNDIQNVALGTMDSQFDLRAERAGNGDGRIYTIGFTAEDASGNQASDGATVTVDHDRGS